VSALTHSHDPLAISRVLPFKVFVSYSRTDKTFVEKLVHDLNGAEIATWVDWQDIAPGKVWYEQINTHLDTCGALICIMSPASCASKEVQYEVNYALSKKKVVVPVLYRQCEPSYRIASLQRVAFSNAQYPIDQLIAAVRSPFLLEPEQGDELFRLFSPLLRQVVYEYENWSDFNRATPTGPQAVKSMLIGGKWRMPICIASSSR
jgi:hypothetical protein